MIDKAPDAFRTISEAAEDLDLPQHVLRFWETRFTQIKPLKRGGGRRYYRPDDIDFLRGLKCLLHAERYTIKGVQKIIKEQGLKAVQQAGKAGVVSTAGHGVISIDAPVARPGSGGATAAPVAHVTKISPRYPQVSVSTTSMPESLHGKLEVALVELLECKRILASLNPA